MYSMQCTSTETHMHVQEWRCCEVVAAIWEDIKNLFGILRVIIWSTNIMFWSYFIIYQIPSVIAALTWIRGCFFCLFALQLTVTTCLSLACDRKTFPDMSSLDRISTYVIKCFMKYKQFGLSLQGRAAQTLNWNLTVGHEPKALIYCIVFL